MVRELLDRETQSAKKGLGSQISRTNYDFVFLREETFGVVPEHVLRIVPKRKDKLNACRQLGLDAKVQSEATKFQNLWKIR